MPVCSTCLWKALLSVGRMRLHACADGYLGAPSEGKALGCFIPVRFPKPGCDIMALCRASPLSVGYLLCHICDCTLPTLGGVDWNGTDGWMGTPAPTCSGLGGVGGGVYGIPG